MDGELDLVRNLEIEAHLRDCPVCSVAQANHQALHKAFSADVLYYQPAATLQKRVLKELQRANKAETKRRFFSWRWGAAVASVALLGVIAALLLPVLRSNSKDDLLAQEVVSSHVRSLMVEGHLTDVPSSDQHTVKPWFNGKLNFAPTVKDLSEEGFPLIGGRLDYLDNRPVAALVYQHRKHFINLFIWASSAADSEEKVIGRQGYNLIYWQKSGMTSWVISDLNKNELQEFTRIVQQ
jgi:anti-sigma factor RsiW